MITAVKWFYLVTLGVWVGSIIFFSFVVAPTIFRVLQPDDAAKLQRALFPMYYTVGIVCAAVGIVCVGILLGAHVLRTPIGVACLLLIAGCGGANVWMLKGVMPQMLDVRQRVAEARSADRPLDPQLESEWKSMHRLSVQLNGAVLLCGLVLLFAVVYSRAV